MSEKLLSFCGEKKPKHVRKVLSSMKIEEIFNTISGQVQAGGENGVILLRIVFQGFTDIEGSHEKRNDITKKLFNLFNKEDISIKVTSDVIGFLLLELDTAPIKELVDLMDFILKFIEQGTVNNGKSLELLPKILSLASSYSSIPIPDEGTMDGDEYRRMIIDKFCGMRWHADIVMYMTAMLRDIQMSNEELGIIVKKIVQVFNDVSNLQEIPSLIYQALMLSNKGYRTEVLDGIITYFCEKSKQVDEDTNPLLHDDNDTRLLRSVEGTVLLHIIFAAKQDQDLGKEFVKYIKNNAQLYPEKLLSPFSIGLTLAMTHIHRLEEQLFDFLKSFILKNFKDDERRKNAKWTRELFSEIYPVENAVLATVKDSKIGWDHVAHGLINFAFMMIECYVPKQTDHFSILSNAQTPQQRACKLGCSIVQDIFKKQEISREEILQRLLDLIMTKAMSNIKHYLELLKSVVASVPQIVLDCLPKFREVFDYLSMLSSNTAEGILRAVLPLMKVSISIKDSLIVVLRKSMFSKHSEARKVAVIGYLLILKHFRVECAGASQSLSSQINCSQSFSCSQLDISSQARYNVGANEALCLEIIGSLRKTLTQHADVRIELYNGIHEVVCKNPVLSHAVLDLLYQQFLTYYVQVEDVFPPIKLNPCITSSGDIHLVEPIVHLLSALMLCMKKASKRLEQDEDENEALSNLLDGCEESYASLTKRMAIAEFVDFGLDKTSGFSEATENGSKNVLIGHLLLGIYEVLIEYKYTIADTISAADAEMICQLFKKHTSLSEMMKEKPAGSGGKKGQSSTSKHRVKSLISFKCLATMLSAVLRSTEAANEPGLNVLRQSIDFVKYLTITALAKLQQVVDSGYCEGAGGKNVEHILRHCVTLAKAFLQHINGDSVLSDEVLRKDKGKKLGNLCIDGLSHIVEFVSKHLPNKLDTLLDSLDFSPDVISQNEAVTDGSLVFRIIRRMQRLTIKIIISPDEDLGLKEAHTLISMFSHLIQHIEQETEVSQVYTWFIRAATEHNIDDIPLTRAIITKLVHLHHICKSNLTTINKIAQDIHSKVSDIDEDVDVEDSSHFSIINEKTATPTVFVIVLNHLEKILDEIDWAIGNLKNIPPNDPDDEGNTERDKKYVCIATIMIGVVMTLHELSQSAFPLGVSADTITKVVTKMYNMLGAFTKHFIWLYTQKQGYIPPKFERVVKLTGTHLAQQVYAMITYMQSTQNQNIQEQTQNGKNKSKDRKKANLAGKNRALKESRSIPNLIYSIEQFERYLIQLSKKCKIDLMENMRRSTSRDFRINAASLEAALHDASDDDDDDAVSVVEADTSNDTTTDVSTVAEEAPSKRQKLSRNPLTSVNT